MVGANSSVPLGDLWREINGDESTLKMSRHAIQSNIRLGYALRRTRDDCPGASLSRFCVGAASSARQLLVMVGDELCIAATTDHYTLTCRVHSPGVPNCSSRLSS